MEAELKAVSKHMLRLGLGALAHANWHANYFSTENDLWPELSVIQAAHAVEILIKARIAQEHPLLIFEQLPKQDASLGDHLTLIRLMENGRTFQYSDLPHRLWATTGLQVPNVEKYQAFGRLRNTIQHFTSPNVDASYHAIEFIYEVIDPLINQFWNLFAVDYNEDYEHPKYLVEGLIRRGVAFLVSPEVILAIDNKSIDFQWPASEPKYKEKMESKIASAREQVQNSE